MSEKNIQNLARLALSEHGAGTYFRANVGRGWTGVEAIRLQNGDVLIKQARPLDTGLPKGFPDLFGITEVLITPEMVGKTIGVFTGLEAKAPKGKVSDAQKNVLEAIIKKGGIAGVFRSPEEAVSIVKFGPSKL